MNKEKRIPVSKDNRAIETELKAAKLTRHLMQKSLDAFKLIGAGTIDSIAELRSSLKRDQDGNRGSEYLNDRLAGVVGRQNLKMGGGLALKKSSLSGILDIGSPDSFYQANLDLATKWNHDYDQYFSIVDGEVILNESALVEFLNEQFSTFIHSEKGLAAYEHMKVALQNWNAVNKLLDGTNFPLFQVNTISRFITADTGTGKVEPIQIAPTALAIFAALKD